MVPNDLEVKTYASERHVPYQRSHQGDDFGGAQGSVFRAVTKSCRLRRVTEFAVKKIRIKDSVTQQIAKEEIRFLKLCNHLNILKLRKVYTIATPGWESTIFLVTEPWVPMSLQDFIEKLSSSKSKTDTLCPWYIPLHSVPWLSIIKQCLSAVQYLHNKVPSIRHKDLKPGNILLLDESNGDYRCPKVRPIIADLGISKEYVEGAKTSFVGTFHYLAPEQIAGTSSIAKSDIFSSGCCFAWVQAIMYAGQQGLLDLDEALEVGSCRFGINLDRALPKLMTLRLGITSANLDIRPSYQFADELIGKMVTIDPDSRLDVDTLLRDFTQFEISLIRRRRHTEPLHTHAGAIAHGALCTKSKQGTKIPTKYLYTIYWV